MANFDSQKWYQITLQLYAKRNLKGLSLSTSTKNATGSVIFLDSNNASQTQQWQFFPSPRNNKNPNEYILRSHHSTSLGYLTTKRISDDKASINYGNTIPRMTNFWWIGDESMYWTVEPWGDGSFKMWNARNGSAWHLGKKLDNETEMTSNFVEPHEGQSFVFKPLEGKIGVDAYKTLKMPPSDTQPSASVSTTTIPWVEKPGLSTGAQAGIGAGTVAFVLIALLLGVFLVMRRRRRTIIVHGGGTAYDNEYVEQKEHTPMAELAQPPVELESGQSARKQEKGGLVELPPNDLVQEHKISAPVELDSSQLR